MITKFYLLRYAALGCIGLMLIFAFSCSDTRLPETDKKMAETVAPDFSLKDLSGQNFRLSKQKGKPVLLIFVTTWCPTCRSEIPHYINIYENYGKKGLEVAMINIQEPRENVLRFVSKYQFPFKTLLDDQGEVAGAYGIVGVPFMVLIDKNGTILSRQYMAIDILLETVFRTK